MWTHKPLVWTGVGLLFFSAFILIFLFGTRFGENEVSHEPTTAAVGQSEEGSGVSPSGQAEEQTVEAPTEAVESAQIPALNEQILYRGDWGSGAGEFGYFPASPGVAAHFPGRLIDNRHGSLVILDPLNERMMFFSRQGHFTREVSLGGERAEHLWADRNGIVWTLGFQPTGFLRGYDESGFARDSFAFPANSAPPSESVMGFFIHQGTPYVIPPFASQSRPRGIPVTGNQAPVRILPGLPNRAGTLYLNGFVADSVAGIFEMQGFNEGGAPLWRNSIRVDRPIRRVHFIGGDSQGSAFLVIEVPSHLEPGRGARSTLLAHRFDSGGAEVARYQLGESFVSSGERFSFDLDDDGFLYQLRPRAEGLEVVAWRLP